VEPLVEVVPNISEGRRTRLIESLAAVVDRAPGVWLLDRTSDADHNRSVLTAAGTPGGALTAMEALFDAAVGRLDMRRHQGQHPRIGAVDVVPFVPLRGTRLADCVALARRLGRSVAERHGLPVYLYGAAAPGSHPRRLAALRRPGFEGLADALAGPGGAPDYGPARPHPTAGAVAIGAREVLIAWNIQLATTDVAVARGIAATVRESGGGLPGLQALGFLLARERHAQVSMNILDPLTTPLWRVWEEVGRLAASAGVRVVDSELVGLVPARALDAVADHLGTPGPGPLGGAGTAGPVDERRWADAAAWLRLRDFSAARVLEARLAQVLARSTLPGTGVGD
jgi:glutamate formiminotransferase / 5-formyltetrahydrofolate cyclo-ligase